MIRVYDLVLLSLIICDLLLMSLWFGLLSLMVWVIND